MRRDAPMRAGNRFKLALFSANCSGGLARTLAPERWDASWDHNVALARLADAAGIDALIPVARWRGLGGETGPAGYSHESTTWAAGLLALTQRICVFTTIHVALISPVFAAKALATADEIGCGRLCVNVVAGYNQSEFQMFGVTMLEHDERYALAEEWLEIVRRLWTSPAPFDFDGRHYQLRSAIGDPKPYGGMQPLLMSAGASGTGQAFAARNADLLFMVAVEIDGLAQRLAALRASVPHRRIGVFTSGHVVCRPTQREAEDYYHYISTEMADQRAVDQVLVNRQNQQSIPPAQLALMRSRIAAGSGTFPVVGDPDRVAETFRQLSDAGLDGMAIALTNYLDELPYFCEHVLPRMERLGLRAPFSPNEEEHNGTYTLAVSRP
jgi:alkanesulfonate monooxygenase SsuD/methylene tetrahydromethanopterin reductase-like flavin-dependent oxidoreductase (luciferase family)